MQKGTAARCEPEGDGDGRGTLLPECGGSVPEAGLLLAWDPIRDREYLEAGRRQVAGGRRQVAGADGRDNRRGRGRPRGRVGMGWGL